MKLSWGFNILIIGQRGIPRRFGWASFFGQWGPSARLPRVWLALSRKSINLSFFRNVSASQRRRHWIRLSTRSVVYIPRLLLPIITQSVSTCFFRNVYSRHVDKATERNKRRGLGPGTYCAHPREQTLRGEGSVYPTFYY